MTIQIIFQGLPRYVVLHSYDDVTSDNPKAAKACIVSFTDKLSEASVFTTSNDMEHHIHNLLLHVLEFYGFKPEKI